MILPSSSSLTSLAAVRPSSLRFFSMALLRSRAALSSALKVHPMVREHSLIALRRPGSTAETEKGAAKKQKKKSNRKETAGFAGNLCVEGNKQRREFFFSFLCVCVSLGDFPPPFFLLNPPLSALSFFLRSLCVSLGSSLSVALKPGVRYR